MEAFLISTGVVALAEIGDKTQLLAFLLAARFRRPWPIIAAILAATVVNHALAGAAGAWLMALAGPVVMRWVLGVSFLAMAAWTLVPDHVDEGEAAPRSGRGVFATTLIAFFLAEMGDKTQIATVALAAKYALPFTLLSDKGGAVRKLYGVHKRFGLIPGRVTYVIDAEGCIRHAYSALSESDQHVEEALRVLTRG